jgi:3-oxo-5-alpha-steroid 4-dehydrogenase 1
VTTFDAVVLAWTGLAVLLLPIQLLVTAPYGRHTHGGWGPRLPNRAGWIAMELVSLLVFGALFLGGPVAKTAPMWVFFAFWTAHYVNRSLIYPFRTRTGGKRMPIAIMLSAMAFNVMNGGLNGYYLGWLSQPYPPGWFSDPRFAGGVVLFAIGAVTNLWADGRLIALRYGEIEYAIPRGGLFELVSCPNLLGEIVEWSGFALMCWNLPALSFAVWTAANLVPRAISHDRWYRRRFADYPVARKAVIPFTL